MTRRRLVAAVFAVSLVASGCGGSDSDGDAAVTTTGATTAETGPLTLPIGVDALPEDFSASFFAYFPQQLTARPGDTVQFTSNFTGEPHTVAFGTVIDEALTALAAIPAGTPIPPNVQDLLAKAPAFYSTTDTRVDADPQPVAAQPCFLAVGAPPAQEACPDQPAEPPAFDGKQSFYSSGFLPDEATFDVELADDIAPGSYRFMCLVDRTDMTGILNVQAEGSPVTAPADVRKQAEKEIAQAVERVRFRAEQVFATTAPDMAVAGAPELTMPAPPAGERQVTSTVNVFPKEVAVPAGGTVSWTVNGAHIIAFNAPEDARPLYAFDAQGVVRANKKGANPLNSPPRPPGASVVDGGSFDGAGFRNSGLLVGQGDLTYRLTVTKPGTYQYRCLFHTDMEGTLKVG
jgi:plastocyanin